MATVLHNSVGRPVRLAQLTEVVDHLHPLVPQVDRRLHFSRAAIRPILVDLSPVLRPRLTSAHVAELLLILWNNIID